MSTERQRNTARYVFDEILKPCFKKVIKDGELLQVIFMWDMSHHELSSNYELEHDIQRALNKCGLRDFSVALELIELFAEDAELDEVKLVHNPGKKNTYSSSREKFVVLTYFNE